MSESESLGKRVQRLRGEARLAAIGEVVSEWRSSGQSQSAFCREKGIATVTLGRWLRHVEANKPSKKQAPVLVEVGVRGVERDDAYEVMLGDGTWVRVPAGFREGELARLLAALSSAC